MNNSDLIATFRRLSGREIKELGLFVRSPYFNRREKVIRLYDYIAEHIHLPESILEKERAWKSIFGQKEYDDREMRYTMSFLLKTIRQYLAHSTLEEDQSQFQVLLCNALQRIGLDKSFNKELLSSRKWQEKQSLRNAFYHYNNYQLVMMQGKQITRERRTGEMLLQDMLDELTYFYIAEILRQSCTMLSHQILSERDYNLRLLPEVLEHVENNDYSKSPSIMIYYHGFKALSDLGAETHFRQLKKLVEQHWDQFPEQECQGIYVFAINYCIRRLNQGDRSYIREGFELYKSGLAHEVFFDNKILSNFNYKNISRLGIALGEFDWVEHFLKSYKPYLDPKRREDIYRYNLAFFYFQKPDYDSAMDLLKQVNFDDVFNNLDARRMLLRIYYESGEFNALLSLLESFNTYISRHQKDIGYHKQNYLNLIRFMKKMLSSNLSSSKTRTKLIEEVRSTQYIAEKEWLLEQLGN